MDLLEAGPTPGQVWEHRGDRRKGICWSQGKERQRPCWVAVGVGSRRLSQWAREQAPISHTRPGLVIWVLGEQCLGVSISHLTWE